MTTEQQYREIVAETMRSSAWHFETIEMVRDLQLPDRVVGAGFVRNAVWDWLHGSRIAAAVITT